MNPTQEINTLSFTSFSAVKPFHSFFFPFTQTLFWPYLSFSSHTHTQTSTSLSLSEWVSVCVCWDGSVTGFAAGWFNEQGWGADILLLSLESQRTHTHTHTHAPWPQWQPRYTPAACWDDEQRPETSAVRSPTSSLYSPSLLQPARDGKKKKKNREKWYRDPARKCCLGTLTF